MLEGRHPMVADWPAVVMVSEEDDGVSGYMEATLRPYVDGCKEGPVGFIEGWFTEDIPHAPEVFQLLLGWYRVMDQGPWWFGVDVRRSNRPG